MSILTEEEIKIIYSELFDTPEDWEMVAAIKLSGSIESAVLAKLAGMELPEPINRDDTEHEKDYYTATQLHQAYAQGAASVLSAEPSGFISPHDLKMLKEGYPATVVMLLGAKRTQPLYTLKTIE